MSIAAVLAGLAVLGALAGCVVVWRRWSAARRELARVRGTFARYVAPSVVDMLLARKDERLFTGRSVKATILVCRIRNFAHFIEPLSPEETLRYLNEFYGLAGTAIQRHRGIIDTFLGDGIVAVFGVPLENPTQEDDALQAALNIVRHVVAMRTRWQSQHRKPLPEHISGDREVVARVEIALPPLGIVIDNPSNPQPAQAKGFREIADHSGVRKPRCRPRLGTVIDGMIHLI